MLGGFKSKTSSQGFPIKLSLYAYECTPGEESVALSQPLVIAIVVFIVVLVCVVCIGMKFYKKYANKGKKNENAISETPKEDKSDLDGKSDQVDGSARNLNFYIQNGANPWMQMAQPMQMNNTLKLSVQ